MERIPLLLLSFIVAIVAVEISALPQEVVPQPYAAAATDNLKSSPAETTDEQLNLLEPAAGPVPNPNPYTNPEQEQLREYKQDWWQGQGWTPEDEANPYHKW